MMLDDAARFDSNSEEVAASLMDGEVVLINLSTGVYYSADNVGGLIWQLADLGFSVAETVATVAERYATPADTVRPDVHAFLEEMVRERILLPGTRDAPRGTHTPAGSDGEPTYAVPALHVYRDMGDLLALDAPMPGMEDIPWQDRERD